MKFPNYWPRFHKVLTLSLLALTAHISSAAEAPKAAKPPKIVASAIPSDPDELKNQVRTYVSSIAQATDEEDQFSRRAATFCPSVMGIDPRYSELVLSKVRSAAAASGRVTEAKPGCEADLVIIFTEDGDALVDAMQKRRPHLFSALSISKKRELFRSGLGIRWWYGTSGGTNYGEEQGYHWQASNISTGVTIKLATTMVVVDITKSNGYPLDAIASYAAMVSFVRVRAYDDRFAPLPSVLGMFARPGPRIDATKNLTSWDRAFLQSLYRIPADRDARKQRGLLTDAMAEAMGKPSGASSSGASAKP